MADPLETVTNRRMLILIVFGGRYERSIERIGNEIAVSHEVEVVAGGGGVEVVVGGVKAAAAAAAAAAGRPARAARAAAPS